MYAPSINKQPSNFAVYCIGILTYWPFKHISIFRCRLTLCRGTLLPVLFKIVMLLPPRSALHAAPRKVTPALLRHAHAFLLTPSAEGNRTLVRAPSIFRTAEFGRYVVTRFLADSNFYGHRPTVYIQLLLYWFRCTSMRLLIPPIGSSLFANPTY